MNIFDWTHSWMSILPLWLQFVVGIVSLGLTVLMIIIFPRFINYWWNKMKELFEK